MSFQNYLENIFITMQLSPCSMRPRKTGSIRKRAKQVTLMDGRTSMNNIRHCLLLCALAAFSNLFFGPRFFLENCGLVLAKESAPGEVS